jgi:predicted TIM-barrel fold metal-dependent hydrolase
MDEGDNLCPVCAYPVDPAFLHSIDYLKDAVPDLPVDGIVDMHQIIPTENGSVQLQLQMMELLRIQKALLQSVPSKVSSLYNNRKLFALQQSHREKFYISHFMDPRYPLAIKRLKQYAERGVRVIKLLPCLGYYPDSFWFRRFWRKMDELKLVAMIHTGFITARHKDEERKAGIFLNSKYDHPIYFDELARRFPNVQFILCHMGGSMWYEEAAAMVTNHDNVWGDISGSGLFALQRLLRSRATVDWKKIFWGNDSPPWAYPFNLQLLMNTLEEGGALDIAPQLLYENGMRFITQFMR